MTTHKLPYADTVRCFKTGNAEPGTWIEKTETMLRRLGATAVDHAALKVSGVYTFIFSFQVGNEVFRVAWPVLPVKDKRDEKAAIRQAATLLHHECEARCLAAVIQGVRAAFIGYLVLPDGHTVMEASNPELLIHTRSLRRLTGPSES